MDCERHKGASAVNSLAGDYSCPWCHVEAINRDKQRLVREKDQEITRLRAVVEAFRQESSVLWPDGDTPMVKTTQALDALKEDT